jgi:PHP family Zn ribbon phosphoesterase
LKTYFAELHVHTVLSPCGDIEMIPPLIVEEAMNRGINMIAITDHNASANIRAVQRAAEGFDLVVLPGIELQTREEVHALCLFDTLEQVESFQTRVDAALPAVKNNVDFFGEQFVVDETGDYIRREERLLLTSTSLTLKDAWQQVNDLGGMLIPAHIDRKAFGLIPVLGFVPTDVPFDALEISRFLRTDEGPRILAQVSTYPLIQSGDVHYLREFLGINEFQLESPTIAEIRLALHQREGRSHRLHALELTTCVV